MDQGVPLLEIKNLLVSNPLNGLPRPIFGANTSHIEILQVESPVELLVFVGDLTP